MFLCVNTFQRSYKGQEIILTFIAWLKWVYPLTRRNLCYCNKELTKTLAKSLQSRSLDFQMPLDKLKLNKRVDRTNSIIRPQAFGRLRPVLSLLGFISQSQPCS